MSLGYTNQAGVCPSVRPSVNTFKLEFMNISDHNQNLTETSLGWGKECTKFGLDRIRNLFSMATDSSHMVIMGKILSFLSDLLHSSS